MQMSRIERESAALLAVLSICGLGAGSASALLKDVVADWGRQPWVARCDLFRVVIQTGRRAALMEQKDQGPANLAMVSYPPFEAFESDVRLGLFLVGMLAFGLRDAAFILGTTPNALATRLTAARDDFGFHRHWKRRSSPT